MPVIIAGEGGMPHALKASVVSKREFAGYWEYVLDEAIFTSPPHPSWGGAACIGADGRVLGVGSLFVQEARGEGIASQGNMIVPIDLLKPILADLVTLGRVDQPPRPWLGMYASEAEDTVFVAGVASGGPADRAGIKPGDFVLEVAGTRVTELAATFRRIWAVGPAGSRDPAHHRPRRQPAPHHDPLRRPQRFPEEAAAALTGCQGLPRLPTAREGAGSCHIARGASRTPPAADPWAGDPASRWHCGRNRPDHLP